MARVIKTRTRTVGDKGGREPTNSKKKSTKFVAYHADGTEWTPEEYEQRTGGGGRFKPSSSEVLKESGYKKTSGGSYRPPTRKEKVIERTVKASPAAAETLSAYYAEQGRTDIRTPRTTENVGGAPRYSKTVRHYEGEVSQERQARYAEQRGMSQEEVERVRTGQASLLMDSPRQGLQPDEGVTTYQDTTYSLTDSFSSSPQQVRSEGSISAAPKEKDVGRRFTSFLFKRSEQAELKEQPYKSVLYAGAGAAASTAIGMGEFIVSPIKGITNLGRSAVSVVKYPGVALAKAKFYAQSLKRPSRAGALVGTVGTFWGVGKFAQWVGGKASNIAPVKIKQGALSRMETIASDKGAVTMARQYARGKAGVFFPKSFEIGAQTAQATVLRGDKAATTMGVGTASLKMGRKTLNFESANVGIVGKGIDDMVSVFAKTRIAQRTPAGLSGVSKGETLSLSKSIIEINGLKQYGTARFSGANIGGSRGGIMERFFSSGQLAEELKVTQGKFTRTRATSIEKIRGTQQMGKKGGLRTESVFKQDFKKSLKDSDFGTLGTGINARGLKSIARRGLVPSYSRIGGRMGVGIGLGGRIRPSPINRVIQSPIKPSTALKTPSSISTLSRITPGMKGISASKLSSSTRQNIRLRTSAIPKQSSLLRSFSPTALKSVTRSTPTVTPPISSGFLLPSMRIGGKRVTKRKRGLNLGEQLKKYQPSLYSSLTGTKGKPTKAGIKSGFGVRPLWNKRRTKL